MPSNDYIIRENVHPSDAVLYYDPRIDAFGASYKAEDIVTLPPPRNILNPRNVRAPAGYPKSDAFIQAIFSESNLQTLQDGIIKQVAKKGYKIGPQSEDDLLLILKEVVDDGFAYTDSRSLYAEMLRIDTIVVARTVPMIVANITMHIRNYNSFDVNPVNELPLPAPSVTHNDRGREMPGFINKYW